MITLGDIKLFTVEDLASALDIKERTIRDYLKEGKIKGKKLANRWFVSEDSLREYFEAGDETQIHVEETQK